MKSLIIIWVLVLAVGGGGLSFVDHSLGPRHVFADVKTDGGCAPTDTAGRCADKCPAGQFQQGIDKDTGAAICSSVTGCPYGDAVPLGPDCDKLAPQPVAQPSQYVDTTVAPVPGFTGK